MTMHVALRGTRPGRLSMRSRFARYARVYARLMDGRLL
jgi:hypothetical protein